MLNYHKPAGSSDMKAKNILFLTGLFLFTGHAVMAQTYYYNQTKTFYEDGYAYQCDKDASAMVTLYNRENKYTYERLVFKDGRDAEGAILFEGMKDLEDDNWTRRTCGAIADKHFSLAERRRVKGKKFGVTMLIDSSTGKVMEVYFEFLYHGVFATVPVSTYRKIELELKEKIWFTPTAEGKEMKFIMRGWRQEVGHLQPLADVIPTITIKEFEEAVLSKQREIGIQ
jgi:hypothetical protein